MKADYKIFVGFVMIALSILLGVWFWRNYFHWGPEMLEPVVFFGGWAALLSLAGTGAVVLVRGIKAA